MSKKKYIAISKTVILSKDDYFLEYDGFIFGDAQTRDYFCELNVGFGELKHLCFLVDGLTEPFDAYISAKDVFVRFLLPKIKANKAVNDIFIYEVENLKQIRFVLHSDSDLLMDDFYSIEKIIQHPTHEYIAVYESDECSQMLKFDFKTSVTANKTWIFIPPNGLLNRFDFSLHKLSMQLRQHGIKTVLFSLRNGYSDVEQGPFDDVKEFSTLAELAFGITQYPHEKIFYRGWMTSYCFGAFLTSRFDNVIIYLKDYIVADIEYIKCFFGVGEEEFLALKIIFQNSSLVMSHYSDEQALKWEQQYGVDRHKFIFLPEICEQEKWLYPSRLYENISIVHAGGLPPTSIPREFFPTKPFFEDMKRLTAKTDAINMVCVVAESIYDGIVGESSWMYKDWLYENMTNEHFSIVRGKDMDPGVIEKYHWGIFELSDYTKCEELIKYAIPSKFAFYLEAGLPILVNNNISLLAQITKEFGIGLVFTNEDVMQLDEMLNISQERYDILVSNVLKYRKIYNHNASLAISKIVSTWGKL